MPNRIYTIQEIFVQEWKDEKGEDKPIRIYPLVLKKFRKLADILDQSKNEEKAEEENERSFLDVILEATAFCMETYEPGLADIEKLADHVDYPTMSHILEIAGGVTLGSPNPVAATMGGQSF